jgi:hypothetical protein
MAVPDGSVPYRTDAAAVRRRQREDAMRDETGGARPGPAGYGPTEPPRDEFPGGPLPDDELADGGFPGGSFLDDELAGDGMRVIESLLAGLGSPQDAQPPSSDSELGRPDARPLVPGHPGPGSRDLASREAAGTVAAGTDLGATDVGATEPVIRVPAAPEPAAPGPASPPAAIPPQPPRLAAVPHPETGEERVDEALSLLDDLTELPVSEHPALFERVHARLDEVLGDLGSGLPPVAPPGRDRR